MFSKLLVSTIFVLTSAVSYSATKEEDNLLLEVQLFLGDLPNVEALLKEYSDDPSPTAVARTLNVQKRDVLKTLAKVRGLDCVQEAMLETVGHIF